MGVVLAVCCLFPAACHSSSPRSATDTTSVPADLRVVVGEGGGFAGRWTGFSINSSGSVLSWSGPYEEAETELTGEVRQDELSAFWQSVREAGFFEIDAGEPANMTTFLQITADGKTHRVAWPTRPEAPPGDTPHERLYAQARRLAGQAR
jgi:hypothetical protein